jgi:hypothetical protein
MLIGSVPGTSLHNLNSQARGIQMKVGKKGDPENALPNKRVTEKNLRENLGTEKQRMLAKSYFLHADTE